MLKIFVDSASSIKQSEKQSLGVEIIPLRYLMGETEYRDDIDLTIDEFYQKLIEEKMFPKTSLPAMDELEKRVTEYTEQGDEVLILSLSSKISGTYQAMRSLFSDNEKVTVVDTLTAVGGVRLLVHEINRYRDQPLSVILEKIYALIPRLRVAAIPETLDYLLRGGRLSKSEWVIGSLLKIKPIITLNEKGVKVIGKKIGLRAAMKAIADNLNREADVSYPVIPSYTYRDDNLNTLISYADEACRAAMADKDNLDPVIACHWGPNAFGFIYVAKNAE